jgi:hypothetical protein
MSISQGSYYGRYYPDYFTHDYDSVRSVYATQGADMLPAYRSSVYNYALDRQLEGIRDERLSQNDAYRHTIQRLDDHRRYVQPQLSAKRHWAVQDDMYRHRALVPMQEEVDREYHRGLRDDVRSYRLHREHGDILRKFL